MFALSVIINVYVYNNKYICIYVDRLIMCVYMYIICSFTKSYTMITFGSHLFLIFLELVTVFSCLCPITT